MSWTHLEDSKPKARKAHRCHLCSLEIGVGEAHVKRTGVNEDGLQSIRMHSLCESLTRGWDEDEWMYHDCGEFRETTLKEHREAQQ